MDRCLSFIRQSKNQNGDMTILEDKIAIFCIADKADAIGVEKKSSAIFISSITKKDEVREKWEGPRLGPKNVSQLGLKVVLK